MSHHNPDTRDASRLSRRTLLLAIAPGAAAVAGCSNPLAEETGPQERSFDVTITREDGEPTGRVDAADVEDVVQVNVGDTVHFTFTNETDEAVGVHDHATDEEFAIDAGGDGTLEYDATEEMIGRQDIEAWFTADAEADGDEVHDADATTLIVVEVRPQGS